MVGGSREESASSSSSCKGPYPRAQSGNVRGRAMEARAETAGEEAPRGGRDRRVAFQPLARTRDTRARTGDDTPQEGLSSAHKGRGAAGSASAPPNGLTYQQEALLAPLRTLLQLGHLSAGVDARFAAYGTLTNGGVAIRESRTLELFGTKLGRGLYAGRDFAKDEPITLYGGEVINITAGEARKRDHCASYVLRISDSDMLVDGMQFARGITDKPDENGFFLPKEPGATQWDQGCGSMANHDPYHTTSYLWFLPLGTGEAFSLLPRVPMLRAVRDIKAGEEVTYNYHSMRPFIDDWGAEEAAAAAAEPAQQKRVQANASQEKSAASNHRMAQVKRRAALARKRLQSRQKGGQARADVPKPLKADDITAARVYAARRRLAVARHFGAFAGVLPPQRGSASGQPEAPAGKKGQTPLRLAPVRPPKLRLVKKAAPPFGPVLGTRLLDCLPVFHRDLPAPPPEVLAARRRRRLEGKLSMLAANAGLPWGAPALVPLAPKHWNGQTGRREGAAAKPLKLQGTHRDSPAAAWPPAKRRARSLEAVAQALRDLAGRGTSGDAHCGALEAPAPGPPAPAPDPERRSSPVGVATEEVGAARN